MDKDTFLEKIKEIGTLESVEDMRAEIADISSKVSDVYDSIADLNGNNAKLTEQHEQDLATMESLRQANMKLFTQIGTVQTPQKQTEEQTGLKQEPVTRRKFEDLFNDKGEFIKH